MAIAYVVLKLLASKYTYMALLVITIAITCIIFTAKMRNYKHKIESLSEAIELLEVTNTILYKENMFKQSQIELLNAYSNSTEAIEKLRYQELSEEVINAVNAISNDFYNYFIKLPN